MKNVTIKDVAKAAGVSYSTVSRALSGSPEISADTRERILQLCKQMNYSVYKSEQYEGFVSQVKQMINI